MFFEPRYSVFTEASPTFAYPSAAFCMTIAAAKLPACVSARRLQ